jgi:hypothetical protein
VGEIKIRPVLQMFISHNGTPYEREEVRMCPGRIMNAMI